MTQLDHKNRRQTFSFFYRDGKEIKGDTAVSKPEEFAGEPDNTENEEIVTPDIEETEENTITENGPIEVETVDEEQEELIEAVNDPEENEEDMPEDIPKPVKTESAVSILHKTRSGRISKPPV